MVRRSSWTMTIAGTAALLATWTGVALAEGMHHDDSRTAVLSRATGNVVQGPLDMALTPLVVVKSVKYTAETRDYDALQTSFYAPLAATWIGGYNVAAGAYRMFAGLLEVPVGMVLLGTKSFTDWQPEPFFETGASPAIEEYPGMLFDWKYGVQYIGEGE